MKRKICVVTGSRADYGHLYSLLNALCADKAIVLQVIVTGGHLSASQGSTYKIIEKDGFKINAKINILKFSDSQEGIAKSIGLGCQLFAGVWKKLKPDVIVVLGDRFESLSAVIAAYTARIPIAHLHGGETTRGAIDEGIRHSITKMASYHFTANEMYRRRVIQMGEQPSRVFNFGAPALDLLFSIQYLDRAALSKYLKFDVSSGLVAIVTYHPVTLEKQSSRTQVKELISAVTSFPGKVVFTKANVDTEGNIINQELAKLCRQEPQRYKLFDNLGQKVYYSCLKNFDVVIGNSSSGIIEAASFGIPVVNVGSRQQDRVRAANVIDAACDAKSIVSAIKKALTPVFRAASKKAKSPYEHSNRGRIGMKIKDQLKRLPLSGDILKKEFYDL